MKSLYESILSSTGSGRIGMLKSILSKEPSKKKAKELSALWKQWGLHVRWFEWIVTTFVGDKSNIETYAYAATGKSKVLIVINYPYKGTKIDVVCNERGFVPDLGSSEAYTKWIEKLKNFGAKITELEDNDVWKRIEF